jgi:ATP-binding protein involved in chromosome partitioning
MHIMHYAEGKSMGKKEKARVEGVLEKGKEKGLVVEQVGEQLARVRQRMNCIGHKIAIMSGKGGVGKSIVTVNLAISLANKGYKVGILDADINGPCIPGMLGLEKGTMRISSGGISSGGVTPGQASPDEVEPASGPLGIRVASMGLILPGEKTPVEWEWSGPALFEGVWRGQMEVSVIREFLGDVRWGNLDYLLLDLPPSNSDKPAAITQLIPGMDGAVIVTIPSKVSRMVVSRFINLFRGLDIPVLGLIENMSGFLCPTCGNSVELFKNPGGERLAEEFDIPFLGRVPFDARLSESADTGTPLTEKGSSKAVKAFDDIIDRLKAVLDYKRVIAKNI